MIPLLRDPLVDLAIVLVLLLLVLRLRVHVLRLLPEDGVAVRDAGLDLGDEQRRMESVRSSDKTEFVVDSLFLAQVWQYLCHQGPEEVFHYVAGYEIAPGCFALTHLIPVAHAHRSQGRARADAASSIWALRQLDRWGLTVVGHFHCHPGKGREATYPSLIDRRFVAGLATAGYGCVGGIASQDACIRFYADESMPFSIRLIGNCVEEVEENVFQLDYELANGQLPICIPRTLAAPSGPRVGAAGPLVRL